MSPRGSSRSTRSCGSRTARTRTSCCPRCWRRPSLERPRPRASRPTSSTAPSASQRRARRPARPRSSKRPLHRLDPPVRAALRLGAYQLLARHAAARRGGETVDAVGARSPRARGLRERRPARGSTRPAAAVARARPTIAVALSHPDWIVERLARRPRPRRTPARRSVADERAAAVTLRPGSAPGRRPTRSRRSSQRRGRRGRAGRARAPTR